MTNEIVIDFAWAVEVVQTPVDIRIYPCVLQGQYVLNEDWKSGSWKYVHFLQVPQLIFGHARINGIQHADI